MTKPARNDINPQAADLKYIPTNTPITPELIMCATGLVANRP